MALRVGLLGYKGWVAQDRYMPVLQEMDDIEIDPMERDRTDSPTAFDGLDVAVICTPPQTHAPLAIRAIEAGCHVLTEKPMAESIEAAQSMVDAAKATGKKLAVSHSFLYSQAMKKAEKLMPRVGQIRFVNALQLSSPNRRLPTWFGDLPGGLFWDESPHLVYLLRALAGDLRILNSLMDGDVIRANFQGDVPASLTLVMDSGISEWHVTVVGTNGMLDLDLFRDICVWLPSDGGHDRLGVLRTTALGIGQHLAGFATSGVGHVTHRLKYGHRELLQHVMRVFSGVGELDERITGQASLRVLSSMYDVVQEAQAVSPPVSRTA